MFGWIITLLAIFCFYAMLQSIIKIIRQQKHLDDDVLRQVVDTTIKYEDYYEATIGHLGICGKCQQRLDEISRE